MLAKRLKVALGPLVGGALLFGAVHTALAGPKPVLRFHAIGVTAGVGYDLDSTAFPPIGSTFILSGVLRNDGPQFGQPNGAAVGHYLIDCTILTENGQSPDGTCSGIAHVPNGYITFAGNGPFRGPKPNYYAVTGGVGHYANAGGEIEVRNSIATVTLT